MKFYLFSFLFLILSCKSNDNDDFPEPNQFDGEDLFSQSSQAEKTLIGKWYFGYAQSLMEDGTVEIRYDSGTFWPTGDRTDTIQFYSTRMVGYSWDCPYENPIIENTKLMQSESAVYFNWCFPSGVNGWVINHDTLFFYRGYNPEDYIPYPIIELNSDSLFFQFKGYDEFPGGVLQGVDADYAVFYKKDD